jgi:hypothetical protein
MFRKLIELTPDQATAVEAAAKELGQSQTCILREGWRLFRLALCAARKGGRIAVIHQDGTTETILGSWCDAKPAA